MANISVVLHVDVFRLAAELRTSVDVRTQPVGNIMIDIPVDISCRDFVGGRIETNRQFNWHAELAQPRGHLRHRCRSGGAADQNDHADAPALISCCCCLVGERLLGQIIRYGSGNAHLLQSCREWSMSREKMLNAPRSPKIVLPDERTVAALDFRLNRYRRRTYHHERLSKRRGCHVYLLRNRREASKGRHEVSPI